MSPFKMMPLWLALLSFSVLAPSGFGAEFCMKDAELRSVLLLDEIDSLGSALGFCAGRYPEIKQTVLTASEELQKTFSSELFDAEAKARQILSAKGLAESAQDHFLQSRLSHVELTAYQCGKYVDVVEQATLSHEFKIIELISLQHYTEERTKIPECE